MSELEQAHNHLNNLIKAKLKINPGLESVERRKEYKQMIADFHSAFTSQIGKLLKSDLFSQIDNAIHPVEKADDKKRILTESDYLEIFDAVAYNMPPLGLQHNEKFNDAFADFLILVFMLGGQDFLNKQNIPATFILKNQQIINSINNGATRSIKGIDGTTQKWVTDQIFKGRENGLSNKEVADIIREKVPETFTGRSEAIVRTETSAMVGEAEHTTAVKNGASHKEWVTVGDGTVCELCEGNEAQGQIGIDTPFASGDLMEPAHPNCRCLVEYHFTPFQGTIWSGQ